MAGNFSWKTVSPGIPAQLTAPVEGVSNLVSLLLNLLEISQGVVSVVRSFQVGYVDPISTVLDALISEVEGTIEDVRKLGIYTTGDFDLRTPFDGVFGGYDAYERRMIQRFVNRADPTRPDFGPATEVFAVFLYKSFDVSSVVGALDFMSSFKGLFGVPGTDILYPKPEILNVTYGDGTNPSLFSRRGSSSGGAYACVTWRLPQPKSGMANWPVPPPPYFMVEVTTRGEGFNVFVDRPVMRADADGSDVVRSTSLVANPDDTPFIVYGGQDSFTLSSDLMWEQTGDNFKPPDGEGAQVITLIGEDQISTPPNVFNIGGVPVFQRAFFVDTARTYKLFSVLPDQTYRCLLSREDMPRNASVTVEEDGSSTVLIDPEAPRSFHVRVTALTEGMAPWSLGVAEVGASDLVRVSNQVLCGEPSDFVEISFPSEDGGATTEVLTAALLVLILSRSDLSPSDVFVPGRGGTETGLEGQASYLFHRVVGPDPDKFFRTGFADPISFRSDLLSRCQRVAGELVDSLGRPSAALSKYITESATFQTAAGIRTNLVGVTWADLGITSNQSSILLSCDTSTIEGADSLYGLGPTPVVVGSYDRDLVVYRIGPFGVDLARTPGFQVQEDYVLAVEPTGLYARIGSGSADYSPVIYRIDGPKMDLSFCRNVFLQNPEILQATGRVLSVLAPQEDGIGNWYSYKLFPQGVTPVDEVLEDVLRFLNSIQFGLGGSAGVMDTILSALEARIAGLEALLYRIDAILSILQATEIPSASGLVVRGSGTDGVLSALVTADDKPYDSSESYGAGLVLLCGGLPTSVVSVFQSLFTEE